MADPSEDRPSPVKDPGCGSRSADEDNTRDRPVDPSGGGSAPTLSLLPPAAHPPMAQPPMAQTGHSGGRPTKKKAKMGKDAMAGTKGAVVEEPGKKRKSASLENLPGRARTCGICRREFATARALFGHMRCHPDRRWRGAHPPPVSPRREAEVDMGWTRQAEDLASSLLNIGQTILRTEKFKAMEGDQAGGSGVGSSTAALETGQGVGAEKGWTNWKERAAEASGVERGWKSGSLSGDTTKEKKKKNTAKALNYTDEDRRKQIHYQLDLNKEPPANGEDDDDDKEEMPDATSN